MIKTIINKNPQLVDGNVNEFLAKLYEFHKYNSSAAAPPPPKVIDIKMYNGPGGYGAMIIYEI
jgi:hypothetical protein